MRIIKVLACLAPIVSLFGDEESGYLISSFDLEYLSDHPQLPSLELMKDLPILLGKTEEGFIAPREGAQKVVVTLRDLANEHSTYWFARSALQEICNVLLGHFHERDIGAVNIFVREDQIGPQGEDLRPSAHDFLRLAISVAPVAAVRAVGDNPGHQRFVENCPVKEGDLLAPDALENYIFFLNRFPNRRVEMVVGGVNRPEVLGLDLFITESKPWRVYANVANTGPKGLNSWQETVGYVNTQLTGHDDILQVNVSTDSFNRYHSELLSYERPFASAPRVSWEVIGSYNEFSSAQLGIMKKEFVGRQAVVSFGVDWNAYQNRDFFFDLFGGLEYRYINVHNHVFHIKGNQGFLIPILGIELSRFRKDFRFFLEIDGEGPINGATDVKKSNLDRLGRFDVSKDWFLFRENGYVAFFLEPLFSSSTELRANELFFGLYSQYAGNNRLIPELQATVGGLYSVRGFPTAYAAGDNTVNYNLEYLLHLPMLFEKKPEGEGRCPEPQKWDLIFRAFFDGARAVNNKSHSHKFRESNATLLGAGVGSELIIKQNFFLRADWGWALSHAHSISPGRLEFYLSGTIVY